MNLPATHQPIEQLAELLKQRNEIDKFLSQLIGRPASPGHVGEFIAAEIFDIELHPSATTKASDGIFRSGPIGGRTVNVKLYGKRSSLLDLVSSPNPADHPDFYLVLTGPTSNATTSRGALLTTAIDNVYLFNSYDLVQEQLRRGVKLGIASSMVNRSWQAAMIYPTSINTQLVLNARQRELLSLFASSAR